MWLLFAIAVLSAVDPSVAAGWGPWDAALNMGLTALQNSEAVSQTLLKIKEMPEQLYASTQQFTNNVNAAVNNMVGDCDGPCLVNMIKPKLQPKLKKLPQSPCIRGMVFTVKEEGVHRKITLSNGYLDIYRNEVSVIGFSKGEEDSRGGQILYVAFKIPDLRINYEFESKPTSWMKGLTRKGKVFFKLEGSKTTDSRGPNSVVLKVTVPKEVDAVKRLSKGSKCFVRIMGVYFDWGTNLVVDDLRYDSVLQNNFNMGLTKSAFYKLVKVTFVKKGLLEVVKPSLKKMFEPVMKEATVFCDPGNLATAEATKCLPQDVLDLDKKPDSEIITV